VRMIESSLRTVIAPPAIFGAASLPTPSDSPPLGEVSDFALAPILFGEALAAGWPWAFAMRLFLGHLLGRSCDGCLGFIPERGKQSQLPREGGWQCCTIVSSAEQDVEVTVFFDDEGVGAARAQSSAPPRTSTVRCRRGWCH
jgi:hypothetical protein